MLAPHEEATRQRALDVYRVVDTLPEVAYNDIVQIASILCDVPMAVMSLIDRDRQWFKASRGLEESHTPREQAFCAHAIEAPTVLMEVPDAKLDPRFVDVIVQRWQEYTGRQATLGATAQLFDQTQAR